MPKKGKPPVDPLKSIANTGFIGYVEEEEIHSADEPGVIWVEIEKIHDNPYQHGEAINTDDFQALVESIKADGFQGALNVSPHTEAEHYFLNGGGHQRRNAAREAGLTKLPVFVSDAPIDREVLAFRAARENTARVNTSIINLGNLYQQMIDEFGLTQEQIAQRIKKDRNHVKFALTAARSPADIQEMLRQRPDSLRAMIYFRRLEHEEDRKPIMDRFVAGELSTEGVRQAVEAVLAQQRGEDQDTATDTGSHEQTQPALSMPVYEEGVARSTQPVEGPIQALPASPVPSFTPLLPVASPSSHAAETEHPLHPEVSQKAPIQKRAEETGNHPTQETGDRLKQIQAIFQMLQAYRRQVSGSEPLIEAELRIIGEINSVTQQLLDMQ